MTADDLIWLAVVVIAAGTGGIAGLWWASRGRNIAVEEAFWDGANYVKDLDAPEHTLYEGDE